MPFDNARAGTRLPARDGTTPARRYDLAGLSNAPQQKRSLEQSLRILSAAERVLRQSGLEAFTIAAVSAESGVSIGGIYGRFSGREELLQAIRRDVLDRIVTRIESVMSQPRGDLTATIDVFTRELVNVFESVGGLLSVAASSRADQLPASQVERAVRESLTAAARPYLEQSRHPHPQEAIKLLVHLVLASLVREVTCDAALVDRLVGWDTLRRELPRVARAVMQIS